jgi:hypothetical protein
MEHDLTQNRRQAHALLDMLPAEKLNAVRSLLEVLVEPLSRSLALAPLEEEEITSETAEALDRARASLADGEGIPHEEILREFGLRRVRTPRLSGLRWSGRPRRGTICALLNGRLRCRSSTV